MYLSSVICATLAKLTSLLVIALVIHLTETQRRDVRPL